MHLPRTLSWALIFATWTAAVVLFVGDMTIGRVVAVSFFAAKGMAILLTLLALLRNRRYSADDTVSTLTASMASHRP